MHDATGLNNDRHFSPLLLFFFFFFMMMKAMNDDIRWITGTTCVIPCEFLFRFN